MYNTADDQQSGTTAPKPGMMRGKMLHKLDKLSNSLGHEVPKKNNFYNNFRKNKRTASVAESQHKRGFNNSLNLSNLNKENAYRYMSVTPSHKYHETEKNKLFSSDSGHGNNLLKTSTQRMKPENLLKTQIEPPSYKNSSKINSGSTPIEEVKDEYNDSKLSFNATEESGGLVQSYNDNQANRELDIDLEQLILVEDKICALNGNVVQDYYDVTDSVYKRVNGQMDLLAGDYKYIKTVKVSMVLEYIVVI